MTLTVAHESKKVLYDNKESASSHILIPDEISKTVARSFSEISSLPVFFSSSSSAFNKIKQPNIEYLFGNVTISQLIEKQLTQKTLIQILEIGCGSGIMLDNLLKHFKYQISVLGADAKKPLFLQNDQYVLANCERLSDCDLLKGKTFDIIFSRGTFRHFIDPREALIQAYEKLSQDGILIIDQIIFSGLEDHSKSFLDWMNSNGYIVTATLVDHSCCFNYLSIVKTKKTLDLPFIYREGITFKFSAIYMPDKRIKIEF